MVTLSRTVRLVFNPGVRGGDFAGANGYGGKPAARGLARYYEFEVTCRGKPDETTGYLINIKAIDDAVRAHVAPVVSAACEERPGMEPAAMLPLLAERLAGGLPVALSSLGWRVTPTYRVEIEMDDTGWVILRQRFDFAAAHRLHVEGESAEQNRAIFGKCNNPNGHGHNYQVEPAVAVRVGDSGEMSMTLADLERLTDEAVIEPFDHTHLNRDTDEFGPGRLNPSVEHIARVAHSRLERAIAADAAARGVDMSSVELRSVCVWETDRTSATFPG